MPCDASVGDVRHGRTRCPTIEPPAVPLAIAEEEDVVEEIVRAEPQTQSVQIFYKRGDEVVVVKEEDTPEEMR